MAGYNLSDDIALLSDALSGLFRESDLAQRIRVHNNGLGKAAKAAGCTLEQAREFVNGNAVLPPRQSVSLVAAIVDQERAKRVASAEYLASLAPGPDLAETTEAGMRAAVEQLTADFPGWEISLPRGHEALSDGSGKTKLIWSARRPGQDAPVNGSSAAELRSKMENWKRADAERAEADKQGRRSWF